MSKSTFFLLSAVSGLLVLTASVPANAQDECGQNCHLCGDQKWEGWSQHTGAPYHMTCAGPAEEQGCNRCESPSIRRNSVEATAIAMVLVSARKHDVSAIVAAYGDRMSLNAGRNVVVIHGTGCSPSSIGTVAFVSASKMRALARLGIREWRVPAAIRTEKS